MSFYITLYNQKSKFSTQLNDPIYLKGNYQVSLTGLNLDSNILKVKFCKIKIKYKYTDFISEIDIILNDNISINDFIKKLNLEMTNNITHYLYNFLFRGPETKHLLLSKEQFLKTVAFVIIKYFKLENNKIIFEQVDGFYLTEIEGYMKKFFAQDLTKLTKTRGLSIISNNFVDLPQKIQILNNIYIHTNIIDYQYFGNSKLQILRTIPYIKNYDYFGFDTPYYVQVKDTVLNTINIEFRDIFGSFLIIFLIIFLHF